MAKNWCRGKQALGLALVLVVFCLGSCTSMEGKRDNFIRQGKELYEKGDYVRARLQFKNAVQIDPKWAEGYLWVGKTELKLGNYRNAFGALSQAVELDPKLIEAQILLGNIFLLARRPDDAEAKANLALKQEPENTEALMLAASVAVSREQPQKALDLLAKVRSLDPGKISAYLLQSNIEVQQQRPEAAAATLEAGLKANPKAVELYLARARLSDRQKQFDQGEAALLKALELEPNSPKLQAELVRHYSLAGQWEKAEQALRRNLSLEPDKEGHALELARFLAGRGRPQEAEQTLKDFVSRHPENFSARFALADFYASTGRGGKSATVLREIIAQDPSGPRGLEAKNKLARLRLSQWRLEEVEKLVSEVLKDNPKDMAALQTQGLVALAKEDGLKAVNNFRIITQDQPTNPEAWLLLARAHLLNNEPEQAKEMAKKALELKPDYLEARNFLYGLFLQAKDYPGAIQTIKGYLRLNETDVANLSALGEVYALKGDSAQARSTFQKIVNLEPQNPLGYYKLGLLSREQKHPEQALKYLRMALDRNPNYLPALQNEVGIYLEQKQPEKALEAVRQTLARSPKNAQLHLLLGEILLAQKQPQAAASALEEALAINPNPMTLRLLTMAYRLQPDQDLVIRRLEERVADPKAPPFNFLILAALYEHQQKFDKAIDLNNTLLSRDLFTTLARNNLAYLLADHHPTPENLEKALKLASESLEENPEEGSFLDTMGWVLGKQGNYDKAKTYLVQAVERSPGNPTILYHLGWCAAKSGETKTAREYLEKALAVKSGFPERTAAEELLRSLPAAGKP
jgi:tetratricopeptide (TPR) repeat protein